MGVKDILKKEEIDDIIHRAKEHGDFISYKTGRTGKEPYENNSTWWSASIWIIVTKMVES
jgi:sucrose phosphorylase